LKWPPKFWKFHLETAASNSASPVGVAFTDSRRFARIRLVDCPGADIRSHSPLVENGPDPVIDRDRFTEAYLREKMRLRHVPVKALLLDQAMISGIGNWVGDEVLYQASLHPEQYSDDFTDAEIARLHRAICYVCDTAIAHLGDSDRFPDDWLFNHRWGKGKKDAATTLPSGEKIVFVTVGGRTSCVVPSRQKKTGRVAAGMMEVEPKLEPETKTKIKAKAKAKAKTETLKEEKQESRFFVADEDGQQDDKEAEPEAPPAKRPRTASRKAVKEEDDESVSIDTIDSEPKRGRGKAKKKLTAAPPATGRRQSARLMR
jgi:formamidopyrimidine-DNA glycosylase